MIILLYLSGYVKILVCEPFIFQLVTPIIFTISFLHYSIFLSYFKVIYFL